MRTALRLAGGTLALVSMVGATTVAGADDHQVLNGTFRETTAGDGLGYDIHGSAKVTVGADGTVADVNIAGLTPVTKQYGSHVHNGTCASGGGGHYQDAQGGATTPPNELWLSTSSNPTGGLDANPGGVVHATGSADWEARLTSQTLTNARSIVVHEPGGARIACADLT